SVRLDVEPYEHKSSRMIAGYWPWNPFLLDFQVSLIDQLLLSIKPTEDQGMRQRFVNLSLQLAKAKQMAPEDALDKSRGRWDRCSGQPRSRPTALPVLPTDLGSAVLLHPLKLSVLAV
ncbi:unnamed protein product, partial [Pleuronectes platessa]